VGVSLTPTLCSGVLESVRGRKMFRYAAVAGFSACVMVATTGPAQPASTYGHYSDSDICLKPKDASPDDMIAACWKSLNSHMLTRNGVAFALNNLAVAYRDKEDWNSALNALNAAIKLEGDTWQSLLNRGAVYDRLGKADLALADFDHAIAINSEKPVCFRMRGEFYLSHQKFDLAAADFTRAILLDSKDAKSLYLRSVSRRHLGNDPGAAADISSAKQLEPNVENASGTVVSKATIPSQ